MELFLIGLAAGAVLMIAAFLMIDSSIQKTLPTTETFTSRVRVPATWRNNDPDWNGDWERDGVADFQLGPGPCGLTVTALEADWAYPNKEIFSVTQRCSNGESKTFHYRREDITGRIEISYDKRVYTPRKN